MGARRWALVVGAVIAVVLVAAGLVLLAQPPRPDLPYPSGQRLDSVRGNCASGHELLGCSSREGPRSFLTVTVEGDQRAAFAALTRALVSDGWSEDATGRTGRDFAEGGAAEDLQPVYCKKGCVALFRFVSGGYELAWFR